MNVGAHKFCHIKGLKESVSLESCLQGNAFSSLSDEFIISNINEFRPTFVHLSIFVAVDYTILYYTIQYTDGSICGRLLKFGFNLSTCPSSTFAFWRAPEKEKEKKIWYT